MMRRWPSGCACCAPTASAPRRAASGSFRGHRRRRQLAAYYRAELKGVILPVERGGTRHCWHLFVVLAEDREAFRAKLHEHGVETLVHYPVPIHRQPAWAHLAGSVPLTVSERLCERVVSLPLYPELTDGEAEQVVTAVNAA